MSKQVSKTDVPPNGFDVVCKSEFPPNLELKIGETFIGGVIMKKVTTVVRNNKPEDVNVMIVGKGPENLTLWESAGLVDLFKNAEVGDAVWISYVKDIELKGRPQPMRGYEGAVSKGAGHEYITSDAPATTE